MTSGSWLWNAPGRRMALLSLFGAFALVFTIACGGGDDDDDAASEDATVAVTVTTGATGDASPTATEAEAATPTEAEEDASPTATEEESEATATEADESTPTEEAEDDASPTSGDTGDTDDPLAEVQPIDPEALPNYTMSFTFDVTGVPEQEDTSLGVEIQQSAVENYHMEVMTGETNVETWLVDGTNYLDQGDGTILPLPEGTDAGLFSPAIFLQEVPPIEPELQAERIGEEEVSGRNTVHYEISAENFLNQSDLLTGGAATDIEGQVEVWIDTELNITIKQVGDITWTNEDGSPGTFLSDLLIFDIGSTQAVEAPQ